MIDIGALFVQFQDHLAPRLDVYEQAIYLYIVRHTIGIGQSEATIGFKSARKKMAFGIGKAGTPPSENIVYEKLKSLELKGCIKILSSERTGTRLRLIVPNDIPGIVPTDEPEIVPTLEEMDFFAVAENRKLILQREGNKCFYCFADLDSENHVIEHVVSRPKGNNSYRNIVAACRRCNNRKDSQAVEDFLRTLYREGFLSSEDLKGRLSHLDSLRAGELRPDLGKRRQ
jgi:hypothetical protein